MSTYAGGLAVVSVNDKESIAEINKLVGGHTVTDVGNTGHRGGREREREGEGERGRERKGDGGKREGRGREEEGRGREEGERDKEIKKGFLGQLEKLCNSLCSPGLVMSVVEYLHGVMVCVAKELTHNSTLKPA